MAANRQISIAGIAPLLLLGACSSPSPTPEEAAGPYAGTVESHESIPPTVDQPAPLTLDGTPQNFPVTAHYPGIHDVSATGSSEGAGVRRTSAGAGRFTQPWAATVIDFRDADGHSC